MSEENKNNEVRATAKVFWPNADPQYMCPIHTQITAKVGRELGYHVRIEPVPIEEYGAHFCECEHFAMEEK
jgi:hypothetical protein